MHYTLSPLGEYVEKLSETGMLRRDTHNRLRAALKAMLSDVQKLGYHLYCNPLLRENMDKMTVFIKEIQEDCRLGIQIYKQSLDCPRMHSSIIILLCIWRGIS